MIENSSFGGSTAAFLNSKTLQEQGSGCHTCF